MNANAEISPTSKVPVYEQVIKFVKSDIQLGIFKIGERIPSINEASAEYLVARDTVEKAYKKLREEGIIESVPGKGYFVANTELSNVFKVCLLFNKMGQYKKETYDSFIKVLEEKAIVDLYIYNYNIKLFERIIDQNINNYDYFVIIPHFHPGTIGIAEIIKKIPKEKVLLIDKKVNQLNNEYPSVYQDFEADITNALWEALPLLKKYTKLILANPRERFFSVEIPVGFANFCKAANFQFSIIDKIENETLFPNQAFVVISDEDLVCLIKKAKIQNLSIGLEIGIIAYNENPVKEILEGGITTISTNHNALGEMAAKMLLSKSKERIQIPFQFIQRKSL